MDYKPLDIFKIDDEPLWIEAVDSLVVAMDEVAKLYRDNPGKYRVYDQRIGYWIPEPPPASHGLSPTAEKR